MTCHQGLLIVTEGLGLYRKCKIRFLEANFNLRKWRTNNEELRQIINEAEGFPSDNVTEKVLGINWNESTDSFEINLNVFLPHSCFHGVKCTPREVLGGIVGF